MEKNNLSGDKTNATIDDLIEFIKNNSPNDNFWMKVDWMNNLNSLIPNWISLIKDPSNWDKIESLNQGKIYRNLCELFVDIVGVDLVMRWYKLPCGILKDVSKSWLKDLDNINPQIWQKLENDMKEYVIYWVFEEYPGEPLETYDEVVRNMRINNYYHRHGHYHGHEAFQLITFPQIGYIPSIEISKLRSIIQRAGDKESLRIVDKLISERKKAFNLPFYFSKFPQFLYHPSRDERELIAYAMDIFRNHGYQIAPLPEIYLSFEIPPLFVAYPELEEEIFYEESEKFPEEERSIIPRNKKRGKPETVSIEELLGSYNPDHAKIVLYERGIRWFAVRYKIDKKFLRMIVLIHEIGHWITHLLPKPNVLPWPIELYKLTSQEVHEGWAQLITYWVVNKTGYRMEDTFEELNKHQSNIYKVYEQFKNNAESSIVDSLENLRGLKFPAKLEDWKKLIEKCK